MVLNRRAAALVVQSTTVNQESGYYRETRQVRSKFMDARTRCVCVQLVGWQGRLAQNPMVANHRIFFALRDCAILKWDQRCETCLAQRHNAASKRTTRGLVVVDVDPFQLEVRVAVVGPCGVNSVLIGDDLWENKREK
jgi:hypothetical protein